MSDGILHNSASAEDRFTLAMKFLGQGQIQLAKVQLEELLKQQPDFAEAWHELGLIFLRERNFGLAQQFVERAITCTPKAPVPRSNLGNVFYAQGRFSEAEAQYQQALTLDPNFPEAYVNLGLAQQEQQHYAQAIESFTQAIFIKQNWPEPYLNRGIAYRHLNEHERAMKDFKKSILYNYNDLAIVHMNIGITYADQKKYKESFDSFVTSIKLNPNEAKCYANFGHMLCAIRDNEQAIRAYENAIRLNPADGFCLGSLIHRKCLESNWSNLASLRTEHNARAKRGERVAELFGFMGFGESEEELFIAARTFANWKYPTRKNENAGLNWPRHPKIRIGYVSGELRDQANGHLLIGLIESHDRERYDVYAFDNGWRDESEVRLRMEKSFKEIIPISGLSDIEAGALIKKYEIDVLIDLNGFFGQARMGVFAQRPAPVQVSYLGCPGTTGVDFMDYLIADGVVIPPESTQFYSEKIVRLPNSYQCNDNKRKIAELTPTRKECGLPEGAFVFCCFNNNYKILPEIFDRWAKILKKVKNSVLWLHAIKPSVINNLKSEAAARGISPERIIFAGYLPQSQHLARHRLANLFLDTLPYNAHTTASDALWAGLPVLTMTGTTFPGRVATSLLKAVDMPELITTTPEAYEALAVDLAMHPEKLAAIKVKLEQRRLATPLFNTKLFTKHFEVALTTMYERSQKGLPPDYIEIRA